MKNLDDEGYIWCGGEAGEIFCFDPDGRHMEQVSSTGGFTLGLALDHLYRFSDQAGLELLYHDVIAHTLCHPTNCAFRGKDLFVSNLGRWHITKIADAL